MFVLIIKHWVIIPHPYENIDMRIVEIDSVRGWG